MTPETGTIRQVEIDNLRSLIVAQTDMFRMYLERDSSSLVEVRVKQEEILKQIGEIVRDHEDRLRKIESWQFRAMGGVALVSVMLALGVAFFKR